jgi:hypothetical protein
VPAEKVTFSGEKMTFTFLKVTFSNEKMTFTILKVVFSALKVILSCIDIRIIMQFLVYKYTDYYSSPAVLL